MQKVQKTIYLEIEELIELKEMQEEIKNSGSKASINNLISEAVGIMLSFYRDDVLRNYKKQNYYKK